MNPQNPNPYKRNTDNASELRRRLSLSVEEGLEAASNLPIAASAHRVNRTQRLVRERARTLQARRSMMRSLWLPMTICAGLVILLCAAVWSVLDQYELEPTGMPDPSQQIIVLLMWCLPLSAILLAVVWFRRTGNRSEHEPRP